VVDCLRKENKLVYKQGASNIPLSFITVNISEARNGEVHKWFTVE
jgi:hypothetical protein